MCAETWESRWVPSTFKSGDEGKWDTSAGKYYGDAENKGLHTTTDYRWCANLCVPCCLVCVPCCLVGLEGRVPIEASPGMGIESSFLATYWSEST